MNKVVVALDLDDTLWDFVGALLPLYNIKYNDHVQKRDITDWNIHTFLKPECKSIFKEFATEDFFEDLAINYRVIELLEKLRQISNVYFVTSCAPSGLEPRAKILRKYLGFYNDSMLIRMTDKSRFVCDYILDDNPNNCIYSYRKSICIAQPWNEGVADREPIVAALERIIAEIKGKVAMR